MLARSSSPPRRFPVTRRAAPLSARRATLRIVKAGALLDEVDVGGRGVTVIGRGGPTAHLVQEHPSLSRAHVAIVHEGDSATFLVDLDSTHGTFVGSAKLRPWERYQLWPPLPTAAGASSIAPSAPLPSFSLGGSARIYTLVTDGPRAPAAAGGDGGARLAALASGAAAPLAAHAPGTGDGRDRHAASAPGLRSPGSPRRIDSGSSLHASYIPPSPLDALSEAESRMVMPPPPPVPLPRKARSMGGASSTSSAPGAAVESSRSLSSAGGAVSTASVAAAPPGAANGVGVPPPSLHVDGGFTAALPAAGVPDAASGPGDDSDDDGMVGPQPPALAAAGRPLMAPAVSEATEPLLPRRRGREEAFGGSATESAPGRPSGTASGMFGRDSDDDDDGDGDGVGPRPPPTAAAGSVRLAPQQLLPASLGPRTTNDPPAASLHEDPRAAERRAREAEIAAAVASLRQPLLVTRHPALAPAAGASATVGDEGEPDGDGENVDELDAAAHFGLPTAFGAVPRPAKRARRDASDGDDAGGAATVDGSASAPAAVRPTPAPPRRRAGDGDDDDDAGDDDGGGGDRAMWELARRWRVPVEAEAALQPHRKAVTALAWDRTGAHIVTGSNAYTLRMYDFGVMDGEHRPSKEVVPHDGHPVTALAFSDSGERLVVGTTNVKVRIYTRDLEPVITTVRGDMYVRDVTQTSGHTAGVVAAGWHPSDPAQFWTASQDSSFRWWNIGGKTSFDELVCSDVLRCKDGRGLPAAVTAATLSVDGRTIVTAVRDGSVQLFSAKAPGGYRFSRPDATVRDAHAAGDAATTCVAFAPSGWQLATRGSDETVKVWDVRRLAAARGGSTAAGATVPLAVFSGIATHHGSCNVAWSPGSDVLVAGVEAPRGSGARGSLRVCKLAGEAASEGGGELSLDIAPAGVQVAVVAWHGALQQIAAGCSDGTTRMRFDPAFSVKGAMLSAGKTIKRREAAADYALPHGAVIVAPNALPLFREDFRRGRRTGAAPGAAMAPAAGAGAGAGVGAAAGAAADEEEPFFVSKGTRTFTQYYMQNVVGPDKLNLRDQDPVEVLRGYADRAATADSVYRAAYAQTQPVPVLAATTLEEEREAEKAELAAVLERNVAGR